MIDKIRELIKDWRDRGKDDPEYGFTMALLDELEKILDNSQKTFNLSDLGKALEKMAKQKKRFSLGDLEKAMAKIPAQLNVKLHPGTWSKEECQQQIKFARKEISRLEGELQEATKRVLEIQVDLLQTRAVLAAFDGGK